jgi:hypothetical protein
MTTVSLDSAPDPTPESSAVPRPRLRRFCYEPPPGTSPVPPAPVAPARAEPLTPRFPVTEAREQARDQAKAYHDISRILRVALEVLDRRRSSAQLGEHFAPVPLRCWRVAVMRRRPRSRAQPGRMLMCMPRSGVAEVALPCHLDGRVRAIAARFELHSTGWRCTEIRLG